MNDSPDSARRILDSLDISSEQNNIQARYALLLTMAREKSGIVVTEDSLIRSAVEYYRGHDDSTTVKAHYYLGVILGYKGDYANALVSLMEAADLAATRNDILYLAMSYREQSDIYYRMMDHRKRIDLSRRAAYGFDSVQRTPDATRERICAAYSQIALGYPDSALLLLDSIREIAANYLPLKADWVETRALALQNSKRHNEAISALKELRLNCRPLTAYDYYLLGLSHCALNETASARLYLDSIDRRMSCLTDTLCMLQLKFHIESKEGLYKQALETNNKYFELNSSVTDSLLTHPYTTLVSEYYHAKSTDNAARYKIAEQQAEIWSLTALLVTIFIILLVICAAIIIRYYRKNLRRKRLETDHILADMQQLKIRLQKLSKQQCEKPVDNRLAYLPATLLNSIFKSRLTIQPGENGYKTLGKIAVEFIDSFKSSEILNDLEQFVNQTNDRLMARFRHDITGLPANYYTIALLTFAGFSVESISSITKISEGGYRNARSRIRSRINSADTSYKEEFLSYFPKIRG